MTQTPSRTYKVKRTSRGYGGVPSGTEWISRPRNWKRRFLEHGLVKGKGTYRPKLDPAWSASRWRVDRQIWDEETRSIVLHVYDPWVKRIVVVPEREYLKLVSNRPTRNKRYSINELREGNIHARRRLHDRLGLLEQEPGLPEGP
jgi:hypothetical protein